MVFLLPSGQTTATHRRRISTPPDPLGPPVPDPRALLTRPV